MYARHDNENYVFRMFHMGCPVIYGSKWILTKWLYSDEQMWQHRCFQDKRSPPDANFPKFSNDQRFHDRWTMKGEEY